ncbi:ABC-F family ATP-binding cassette domain-containing protein [Butyrivibrio sp. MC2013]|uniref:ABC-F family ATP-binding cassette domain-containing protein n=1 Tax=Butyrivibrio sp. MC2013 TaxID=1280686 RepID=UPI0003F81C94|nr:ABC-F family ATP-binding cassette domain-containing protein [Butyrivibrio sp. MC2013]
MNLLSMNGISLSHTDKVLLENVSFGVDEGDKIGIIGINGSGKSSLLRIIAGEIKHYEGDMVKGNNVVISYLPQDPVFDKDQTLHDYVVTENQKSEGSRDEYEIEENRSQLEVEAAKILHRLGFEDQTVRVGTLSGGQKKKAALAACLLRKADILLLDEPTNHLDNAMNEWLQDYLSSYKGALVMVTHDRYFLDLTCNRIVEVEGGALYSYDCNYEGYLQLKQQRLDMALSTQDKHANILRKELAWMQRGARARSTKQKAHIGRFEALRDEEKLELTKSVEINAVSSRLGKKTIEINAISKAYGDRELIKDFTYTFTRDDKIGILGPNGCGKTTLINMISGKLRPDSGYIETGDTVVLSVYEQHSDSMNDEMRVIDYVRDKAEYIRTEDGYISASQMCERFLFDGTLQYQKIAKLSGGEKRRLYLCRILMEAPNVLILDEPTNDLDISTLQILEDYLDSYKGILIVISHDRYFLDRTVRRMLTFNPGGEVRLFNGSYTDYYTERRENEALSERGAIAVGSSKTSDTAAAGESGKDKRGNGDQKHRVKFSYNEAREYETIEDDIAAAEAKGARLEKEIAENASDYGKLRQLTEQKEANDEKLEKLMERYFYLEEKAAMING